TYIYTLSLHDALPIFIFVIMYFVMIRPQKKRQQQQQNLITSLKTGDRVVTNAGIHGLISNVKENTVLVKVADNVKIEMEKSAIRSEEHTSELQSRGHL